MIGSPLGVTMLKGSLHCHHDMRLLVLGMLLSAIMTPIAAAETQWEEDGWLATIGKERLDHGDEFGCYGMPGLSWKADPGAVALECKEYVEQRIDASNWGTNVISTYTPSSLTSVQHTTVANQGFTVHGDDNDLMEGAWYSADDVPEWEYSWHDLGRRGGSLERGIADADALSAELDQGGLVNMYWIGRMDDVTIRHDTEVVDMLHERTDVWFTTWGEAYSYWTVDRCNQFSHSLEHDMLIFEHTDTEACRAAAPDAWNVPVTWKFEIGNVSVLSSNLSEMSTEESNTMEGWRQEGSILYVSVLRGHEVSFNLSSSPDYDILGRTQFFNDKSAALTIAGHSTTDLFQWSKRFGSEDKLVFTWLLSPRAVDEGIPWLPYAGLAVLTTTLGGIWLVLRRESMAMAIAKPSSPEQRGGDDDE